MILDWELIEMTEDGMRLKLNFENSGLVSTYVNPDTLKITVKNNMLFMAQESNLALKENTETKKNIPS